MRSDCASSWHWGVILRPQAVESGQAIEFGLNSASGAGTGYPANPIVTLFLASHDATLVCLGEDYYELRYSIWAPRFGDREIDIIDVVFPIVAQSDQDALEIVEVILAGAAS